MFGNSSNSPGGTPITASTGTSTANLGGNIFQACSIGFTSSSSFSRSGRRTLNFNRAPGSSPRASPGSTPTSAFRYSNQAVIIGQPAAPLTTGTDFFGTSTQTSSTTVPVSLFGTSLSSTTTTSSTKTGTTPLCRTSISASDETNSSTLVTSVKGSSFGCLGSRKLFDASSDEFKSPVTSNGIASASDTATTSQASQTSTSATILSPFANSSVKPPFTGLFGTPASTVANGSLAPGLIAAPATTGKPGSGLWNVRPGASSTKPSFAFGIPSATAPSGFPRASTAGGFNFQAAIATTNASSGGGFNFGTTVAMTDGLSLKNTTAPMNVASVTTTSGSPTSLGSVPTVSDSSLGGECNNDNRIICSETSPAENEMKKNSPRKFATTFECFFPLVDNDYWIRASKESNFQGNVSLSMYRYYMAQHLYARLVKIRAAKGLATKDEQRFANHVQSIAPAVPTGIFTYLRTIGDIQVTSKDADLMTHFFEHHCLAWPNEQGHFGRIDQNNHWMYMSFPAPAVVVQAVQEDLDMDDLNPQSVWDVQRHLKPSFSYLGKANPNANLLGWKPATVLTIAQRQKLQLCGISRDTFDVINGQFQFNPKIMRIINSQLLTSTSSRAVVNVEEYYEEWPTQVFGGIAQLGWLEREDDDDDGTSSRSYASVERNVNGWLHPLQGKDEFSIVAGFRVDKSKGSNDWVIYRQDNPANVPEGWMETRNTVFEFGDIGEAEGTAIHCSFRRDTMRHEFLEKCYSGGKKI